MNIPGLSVRTLERCIAASGASLGAEVQVSQSTVNKRACVLMLLPWHR